ncbi:hypothetical protein GCM10010330_57770 [Streptomyces tendae]|nr:hypothetical protein GCM10010330_57770 [Streptomyces tendae]
MRFRTAIEMIGTRWTGAILPVQVEYRLLTSEVAMARKPTPAPFLGLPPAA